MRALFVLAGMFSELLAPSVCAACDAPISRGVLFCAACAPTAERSSTSSAEVPHESAAFEYGGAVATAISRLKYAGRADLAKALAASMIPTAQVFAGAIDLVVPVPLFRSRLVQRGYNQSALLARPIARAIRARFAPEALMRIRDTRTQAELDRRSRLLNAAQAFQQNRSVSVRRARVLLVDDVRTTGATLRACSEALTAEGASEVRWLVLARRT
jgi:ComF family protein